MEGFTQLARTCIASSGVDHDIATVESRRRVGSVAAAHLVVVDDVARRLVPDLDAQPIAATASADCAIHDRVQEGVVAGTLIVRDPL